MAGVRDQLGLLLAGRGQRCEHGIERAGQSGQLVLALIVDGGLEILGGGYVFGGCGEAFDRPDRGLANEVAEGDGDAQSRPAPRSTGSAGDQLKVCSMSVSGRAIWMATGVPCCIESVPPWVMTPVVRTLEGDGARAERSRLWQRQARVAWLTGRAGPRDGAG